METGCTYSILGIYHDYACSSSKFSSLNPHLSTLRACLHILMEPGILFLVLAIATTVLAFKGRGTIRTASSD